MASITVIPLNDTLNIAPLHTANAAPTNQAVMQVQKSARY